MGFGDEIMTTGFARLAKKSNPDAQIVIGNRKKNLIYDNIIFNNNPNIIKKENFIQSEKTIWLETYPGNRPYIKTWDEKKVYWNDRFRAVKGDLYFDYNELETAHKAYKEINDKWNSAAGKIDKKVIFIEPSRKNKNYNTNDNKNITLYDDPAMGELNKCWIKERWQEVINYFKDQILFIQTIHSGSEKLKDTYEFKSDFRTACALMSFCDYFIGWEGGFSHAAAALKKKGVVLFGGWIHPKTTGYEVHSNIYINIEGSPCGVKTFCEHCVKCRELITVDIVLQKLKEII